MQVFNSENKTVGPKAILLIGPPGGGKTTLGLQFPGVGVVDVDRNLAGPATRLLGLNPGFSFKYEAAYKDSKGEYCDVSEIWPNAVRATRQFLDDPDTNTVMFDGLTLADDALVEHVIKEQTVNEMRKGDWVVFRAKMVRLIMECRSKNKTFLMLCHEEPLMKPGPNQTEVLDRYVPCFRSKVGNFFGGYFTDMWHCYTRVCPKDKDHPMGVKFCLDVLPTGLRELKNSFGLTGTIEDVTYDSIKKYL